MQKLREFFPSYFDTLHYVKNVDRYNADTVTEQVLPVGVGNRERLLSAFKLESDPTTFCDQFCSILR